jgi:steroid delta-isomerase-like uncharacterized protein
MRYLLSALVIGLLFSSCMNQKNMRKDEKEKNKTGMTAFYDKVINAHNPDAVDSLCTSNYVEHSPDPGFAPDRDGLKKDLASLFAAFPNVHIQSNFMMADSDMVTAQFTLTGTNSGPFMGMPATGKKVNIEGIDIIRLKNGIATEHWGYVDQMSMMQQLGLMQGMGTPADSGKMKM